jgi:GNAT superfamily N-acetyltransferase
MEIKRMYTHPKWRQKKIASVILKELEAWMKDLMVIKCVLETGKNLPEAVALYHKFNYIVIPNYDPYQNTANSICFEKKLL